jgi:hypothetical protein
MQFVEDDHVEFSERFRDGFFFSGNELITGDEYLGMRGWIPKSINDGLFFGNADGSSPWLKSFYGFQVLVIDDIPRGKHEYATRGIRFGEGSDNSGEENRFSHSGRELDITASPPRVFEEFHDLIESVKLVLMEVEVFPVFGMLAPDGLFQGYHVEIGPSDSGKHLPTGFLYGFRVPHELIPEIGEEIFKGFGAQAQEFFPLFLEDSRYVGIAAFNLAFRLELQTLLLELQEKAFEFQVPPDGEVMIVGGSTHMGTGERLGGGILYSVFL